MSLLPDGPLTAARNRSRLACVAAGVALFALGLASRHYDNPVSTVFGKYPGDTMWAMLAYCGFGFLIPQASIARVALLTAAVSLGVEILKLYHAPWMIALRASTFGDLVLGHIFSFENLAAYTVGITICVTCELFLLARRRT